MPIRDEAINVFMGLPGDGDRLELTYNHGVDSYELGTGYNHIALTVADLDATLAELSGKGIEPEKPPYTVREGGIRICFVRDPDGYRVELIETRIAPCRGASPSSTSARTRSGWSSSPGSAGRAAVVVEAHRRDPRVGAHRRGPDGLRRAAAGADGARAGDDRAVRALLPRHRRSREIARAGDLGDPRGVQPRGRSWRRRASAPGWRSRCSRARRRPATATWRRSTRRRSSDGVALDLGGGSMQLVQVADRRARDGRSWRLGAVRMTERFLPDERVKRKQSRRCKAHVREELAVAPWLDGAGAPGPPAGRHRRHRAQPRRGRAAAPPGLPSYGVQGFALDARRRSTS